MSALSDRLGTLPSAHQAVLEWFDDRRGMEVPTPKSVEGVSTFSPKGIHVPKAWKHAISVRQSLGGQYDDRDPVSSSDGSWTYRYYQERHDPEEAARAPANRALFANRDDDVPVAVMIQVRRKPTVLYRIMGLARVTGFADGYFSLQGYNDQGELPQTDFKYAQPQSEYEAVAEPALPISPEDARRRMESQIVARQGGKRFREAALKRFDRRCAITGWTVIEVLEAAHIVPYLGEHTNTPDNALLLRADLHTLFDRELVTIDPETLQVRVHPSLRNTPYSEYHGRDVRLGAGTTSATLRGRLLARMGLISKQAGA